MIRIAALILLSLAALATVALPVSAAITDIPSGGTVFIGEQGLNIAATNVTAGSQIAFFGSGSNVQTDAPSNLVTVSDPTSFYVSPAEFGAATGAWYTFPGRQLAFIVKDPSLQLRVINGRTGREVGSGAVAGDPLGFRIETNLYSMAQRPGVAGAPITIHIRDPTGAEFTSQNRPVTTSLVNIPVNTSVYDTGPVWAADPPQYQAGTYEVWADSNANGMKDNYNQVGKTTTLQTGAGVQVGGTSGPSITVVGTPTATVTGTATATVTATGTATVNVTATVTATSTPVLTATGTAVATATGTATTAPATTRTPGFAATTLALAGLATLGFAALRRR
jgi:hypothetical protein